MSLLEFKKEQLDKNRKIIVLKNYKKRVLFRCFKTKKTCFSLVVTEVRSENIGLVTERRHYNRLLYVPSVIFFIVECGIARFLCAMRVLNVRVTSLPPGYPCAKFRLFHGHRGLHC